MLKKELEEQLKKANEIIGELNKKVSAYKDGDKKLIKVIESGTQNEKLLKEHITFLEKKCADLEKDNAELEDWKNEYKEKLSQLRKEHLSLIKKETVKKVHNDRGAGRKSKLTTEQLDIVIELHQKGLSYNKIGQEVGLSKAYVYKLIKKHL